MIIPSTESTNCCPSKQINREKYLYNLHVVRRRDTLMKIKQYDIWLANLNPRRGSEHGKTRPVVIVQTNLLNEEHLSTLVCPVTTNVNPEIVLLRVHLKKRQLDKPSDILVDQIRAINNRLLIKKLGSLTKEQVTKLKENIKVVLDLI
jgi:mRNA interferase MazF